MNKKTLLAITLAIALTSCGIKKNAVKTKTDRTLTEQIKTTTFRKGDTITINVPNIRLKDTVIERVSYINKTPSIARITYDKDGNATFECLQAQIEQTNEINRQLVELIKDKDKEKEETFNPQYFIYSLVVLVLIVLLGFIYINNKITKIK